MKIIKQILKDVKCKDCSDIFIRTSRSRICPRCAEIRKNKSIQRKNKKYYVKKVNQLYHNNKGQLQ